MTRPTDALQIRFNGTDWETITGVREIHISYGRQDEMARMEPGRFSAVVDNASGDLSPENASGAYYPNVQVMKRIRYVRTFNAVSYPLFYGWIERIAPVVGGDEPEVTIEATDFFLRLAAHELNISFSEQLSGARIGAVLDELSWPAGTRDLDAGQSTVPAAVLSQTMALQHAQDIQEVEDGLFWIAGDGDPTFRDRHARLLDAVSITSQATFGGAAGLPFSAGEYDLGVDQLYNDVRVTRTGGTEQQAADTAGQANYEIVRTLRIASDHFMTDNLALAYAQWRLGQHQDPVPRLRWIQVEGGGDDSLWVQILARTINDRITVVHQFPGALGLSRDFYIEGVRHDLTLGLNRHTVQWQLSKADAGGWWVLDSSLLGTNTKLGF